MIRPQRQTIAQEWTTIPFGVTAVAQPISGSLGPSSLITTLIFSVPITAANSVFIGPNSGVSLTNGLEIPAGSPQEIRINNERELVEIESPMLDLLLALTCRRVQSDTVPIITWDVSNIWIIATGNTAITIGIFKEMWS